MAGQVIQRVERTWLVRIYLGCDSTTGKRRYLSKTVHGNKKDAQRYLHSVLRDRDNGALVTPSRTTLSEFLTRWLQDYAAGAVGPVTYASYQSTVRLHLAPALGDYNAAWPSRARTVVMSRSLPPKPLGLDPRRPQQRGRGCMRAAPSTSRCKRTT